MIQQNFIQNKISPNNGILLNGVLRPKLLNNALASCFLINLDFLLPHILHFDNSIVLLLLVGETLGFMLSVFFFFFFYTLDNMIALLYTSDFKLLLIISLSLIIYFNIYSFAFINQLIFFSITSSTFHHSNIFF